MADSYLLLPREDTQVSAHGYPLKNNRVGCQNH